MGKRFGASTRRSFIKINIKNVKNKILSIASVVGLYVATAPMAFADAFGTSTAPTTIASFITDIAVIIGAVVGLILGLLAALIGLRWGVSKFKQYVSGRKF